MSISVRFDDRKFRLSHTRAPRGRGSWAFSFDVGDAAEVFAPGSMTLVEAKAWARNEAHRRAALAKQMDAIVYVDILP